MTIRLQHCGLVVSDLERSRRFYGEALGLEELPRPSNFAFAGAWFALGDTEIHLLAEADTTGRAGQPRQAPASRAAWQRTSRSRWTTYRPGRSGWVRTAFHLRPARCPAVTASTSSSSSIRTVTWSSCSSGRARIRPTRPSGRRSAVELATRPRAANRPARRERGRVPNRARGRAARVRALRRT